MKPQRDRDIERGWHVVKLHSWLQAGNWDASRRSQGCFAVTLRPKCADCTSLIAARDFHSTQLALSPRGLNENLYSQILSESSTTTLWCYVFLIATDQNPNTLSILAVDVNVWLQLTECWKWNTVFSPYDEMYGFERNNPIINNS